jgi:hypothetical protein
MEPLESVIKIYGQALKDNDYQTIISLFSEDAKVFSLFAGEKSPSVFFQNLFECSHRTKVEIKNIFFDPHDEKIAAAYIYMEAMRNQHVIQAEAVDVFKFDHENKIKRLKIFLDTYLR